MHMCLHTRKHANTYTHTQEHVKANMHIHTQTKTKHQNPITQPKKYEIN